MFTCVPAPHLFSVFIAVLSVFNILFMVDNFVF